MTLNAGACSRRAGRPTAQLTRRDVARALLAVSPDQAIADLPVLQRELTIAGNSLSPAFWRGAGQIMAAIADRSATVGDVQDFLAATGTEPAGIIGNFVFAAESERSVLQADIHHRLVGYLEDLLAAGQTDPDLLAAGDPVALLEHQGVQEAWMMTPLPDGRVPMWVVADEEDEQFLAAFSAAAAQALAELRDNLRDAGDRPVPEAELLAACASIRSALRSPGWPRDLLAACGGLDSDSLPRDPADLWLVLAAGIISPREELPAEAGRDEPDGYEELTADEQSMLALCTLDHGDWLAVATTVARAGPGLPAAAADLAGYVAAYDPGDVDDQADAAAGMFEPAAALLQVLGAIDGQGQLTSLGWWGIPAAAQRAFEQSAD